MKRKPKPKPRPPKPYPIWNTPLYYITSDGPRNALALSGKNTFGGLTDIEREQLKKYQGGTLMQLGADYTPDGLINMLNEDQRKELLEALQKVVKNVRNTRTNTEPTDE